MHNSVSPFAAPPSAQQVVGVPMYYHANGPQQAPPPEAQPSPQPPLPQNPQVVVPLSLAAAPRPSPKPAPLPFPYGARCGIYSAALLLSIVGCIFAIIGLCSEVYMKMEQTKYENKSTTTCYYYVNTMNGYGINNGWYYSYDTLKEAAQDCFYSPYGYYTLRAYVRPPAAAEAASVTAIIIVVCSVLLVVVSSVVLGILGCERRRARQYVAAEDNAARQQQTELRLQQQVREATATGAVVYIVVNDERALGTYDAESREKAAAERAKRVPHDTRVRRGLGITCLVLSAVCLVVSVVGLACGVSGETVLRKEAAAIEASMAGAVTTSYTKAANSTSVWVLAVTLVLFFISTVLLSVPYLSGISDRPTAAEETAATENEEMQVSRPYYPVSAPDHNANKNYASNADGVESSDEREAEAPEGENAFAGEHLTGRE